MIEQQEFAPGIHEGLDDPVYRAINLPSKSEVWSKGKDWLSDQAPRTPNKDSLRIGCAVHTLTLEGQEAYRKAFWDTGLDFRRDARAKQYQHLVSQSQGRELIKRKEAELIWRMAGSIHKNDESKRLLNLCVGRESTVIGEFGGALFKGRIDGWGDNVIIDIKTTRLDSPGILAESTIGYGYHAQAGLYTQLLESHLNRTMYFYLIFVSKEMPHNVRVHEVSPAELMAGRAHLEDMVKLCRKEGLVSCL